MGTSISYEALGTSVTSEGQHTPVCYICDFLWQEMWRLLVLSSLCYGQTHFFHCAPSPCTTSAQRLLAAGVEDERLSLLNAGNIHLFQQSSSVRTKKQKVSEEVSYLV